MANKDLIRRVLAVQMLLNCREIKQEDIRKGLNHQILAKNFIEVFKEKWPDFAPDYLQPKIKNNEITLINSFDLKEVSKQMVSNLRNGLEKDGIIKVIPKRKNGKGGSYNCWKIFQTEEVLWRILQDASSPIFDSDFSFILKFNIVYSDFGKKLINIDLVNSLKDPKYYMADFKSQLTKEYIQSISQIIKVSPSALLYLLQYKHDRVHNKRFYQSNMPNEFIFEMLLEMGKDFNNHQFTAETLIDFSITVDLKPPVMSEKEVENMMNTKYSGFSKKEKVEISDKILLIGAIAGCINDHSCHENEPNMVKGSSVISDEKKIQVRNIPQVNMNPNKKDFFYKEFEYSPEP